MQVAGDNAGVWSKARIALWRWRRALAASALSVLVLGCTFVIAGLYLAQDARLGVVHFPTSCGWQSQRDFTTATSLLHLFQFADAEDLYRLISKRDPNCGIAYWGIAMSRLKNPLYELPSSDDVAAARAALRLAVDARSAGPRERAYLAAANSLFDPTIGTDWNARLAVYANAMSKVVEQFPEDREARIFYALALNLVAATDNNKLRAERTKAAELLLQVFSDEPNHPGIGHYLTFCLGHAAYQPKPFERAQMTTPAQRILLGAFAFVAVCGLGAFLALTSDMWSSSGNPGQIGGPFMLTTGDGRVVTDRTFRGRWMLVYFGYTHCPDVCPTTLLSVAQMLEKLGPVADNIQPIFVTLDPERDTPEVMAEFTKAFDPRIIGLTGKAAEIAAVAKDYRVFFKKVKGNDGDDYFLEHSSYIYVMNPDGRYVTLFSHDQIEASDDVAARLRELLVGSRRHDGKSNTNDSRVEKAPRSAGAMTWR
jgi:protein SCO1